MTQGAPSKMPRRHRVPLDRSVPPRPPRFWDKVDIGDESACWLWTRKINNMGYGQVWSGGGVEAGRWLLAHRVAYEDAHDRIPDGMVLDHLCANPACCNPQHLEVVTQRENLRRAATCLSTINALKTHCKHGHPLAGDNLYIFPSGKRGCRACARLADRRRRSNKAGAA